jgi:hypothetical protein
LRGYVFAFLDASPVKVLVGRFNPKGFLGLLAYELAFPVAWIVRLLLVIVRLLLVNEATEEELFVA